MSKSIIGVVLGARHFGDAYIEKWVTFAGEEVSRSGRGTDLGYVNIYNNEDRRQMYLHGKHGDDRIKTAIDGFGPLPGLDIDKDDCELDEHIRAIVRDELEEL